MQITKWKSLRLLLLPWFAINLFINILTSFLFVSPDAFQIFRSVITWSVIFGCIFYALGVRFLNRTFWQYLLVIGISEKLIAWFEVGGVGISTTLIHITYYFVLALYAFQNKTIWQFNQAPKNSKVTSKATKITACAFILVAVAVIAYFNWNNNSKPSMKIQQLLKDKNISDDFKQLIKQGTLKEAEVIVDQNYEKKLVNDEQKLAQALYDRGRVKELNVKYQEALRAYSKAALLQPKNSLYLNKAGILANDLGQHQKAIAYFEQALKSDIKLYGEDHLDVAGARNNLGRVYYDLGQYQRAIENYEQALKNLTLKNLIKTNGEDHPAIKIIKNNLSNAKKKLAAQTKEKNKH